MGHFQYVARPQDAWERRANQSGTQYIGIIKDQYNVFRPRKDDNSIRILPPTWENPLHYGYDIWVHFGVGPEKGQVLCLQKMKHQRCPICDFQVKAEEQGREDAGDYKPIRRVVVWIVDRKAEKPEDNPMVWAMPWTVDRDISAICRDKETGELYMIDHPEAGFDVYFTKTGEKEQTKYVALQLARRSTTVDSSIVKVIADNPIPSVLIWRSYEEVNLIFSGEIPIKEDVAAQQASAAPPQVAHPGNGIAAAPPQQMPSAPPVQAQQPGPVAVPPLQPPPPPIVVAPPPPPKVEFKAEWTGRKCSQCGQDTWTVDQDKDGVADAETCQNGHTQRLLQFDTAPSAPPPQPPAQPKQTIEERAQTTANVLKARFQTGPK